MPAQNSRTPPGPSGRSPKPSPAPKHPGPQAPGGPANPLRTADRTSPLPLPLATAENVAPAAAPAAHDHIPRTTAKPSPAGQDNSYNKDNPAGAPPQSAENP